MPGHREGANLPDRWSATENVAWKCELPGRGWSSPIVSGQRVFLTTAVNFGESEAPKKGLYLLGERPDPPTSVHEWKVICLDLLSGRSIWERTVHQGAPKSAIHLKNTFASETPVTEWPTRVCLLRKRGALRLRHGRQASLVPTF